MKNIKLFVLAVLVVFGFSACSESWLDNDLTGNTISREEFESISSTTEGQLRGLYTYVYSNASSSSHQNFGQKAIDMTTDFLSGDMSMGADAYGWFVSDARYQSTSQNASRNSYIWTHYYSLIMNVNALIRKLSNQDTLTVLEKNYYAQALTMRAHCYFNLLNLYTPGRNDNTQSYLGGMGDDYRAVPVYTEFTYTDKGLPAEQDLSTKRQLIDLIHSDLDAAIAYFDEVKDTVPVRSDKLFVNADIARVYQAYTYMIEERWDSAYNVAVKVINEPTEPYAILPYDEVLTTGFASLSNPSWMWGHDVTIETTGGLASFWGHMDVHTYSYAQAGATKVIDSNLYDQIPEYDIRKQWFDAKKLNPDYKFYDLARGTGIDVDRRWLNDIVFMRIEEVYLIAAEAAARDGHDADAQIYLKALVDERYKAVDDGKGGMIEPVDVSTLTGNDLLSEIERNWRVELWGEGRSLMTYKRFANPHTTGNRVRVFLKSETLNPVDHSQNDCLFRLPSGEQSSNGAITYQRN
ncbi:MAG: RagB/SusD family nutrient uptake outer membrane protein [Candidatus Aphodosoma sp.]